MAALELAAHGRHELRRRRYRTVRLTRLLPLSLHHDPFTHSLPTPLQAQQARSPSSRRRSVGRRSSRCRQRHWQDCGRGGADVQDLVGVEARARSATGLLMAFRRRVGSRSPLAASQASAPDSTRSLALQDPRSPRRRFGS